MDSSQVLHVTELSGTLAKYGPSAAAVFLIIFVLAIITKNSKMLITSKKIFWLYCSIIFVAVGFLAASVYDFFASKKEYYSIVIRVHDLPDNAYLGDRYGFVFSNIKYDHLSGNHATVLHRTSYKPNCVNIRLGELGNTVNKYEIELEDAFFHPDNNILEAFITTSEDTRVLGIRRFGAATNRSSYKLIRPFSLNNDGDLTSPNSCSYRLLENSGSVAALVSRIFGGLFSNVAVAAQSPYSNKTEVLRLLNSDNQIEQTAGADFLSRAFESNKPLVVDAILSGAKPNVLAASLSAYSDQKPIVRMGAFLDHKHLDRGILERAMNYLVHPDERVRFQAIRFMRRYPGDAVRHKLDTRYDLMKRKTLDDSNRQTQNQLSLMSLAMMDWYYNRGAAIWRALKNGWKAPRCASAIEAFERSFQFRDGNQHPEDAILYAKPLYGHAVFAEEIASGNLNDSSCPALETDEVHQRFIRFIAYVKVHGADRYVYQSHIERAAAATAISVKDVFRQDKPVRSEIKLLTGVDLPGNDYNRINTIDLDRCKQACVKDGQCKAFTYDSRRSPNGVCWLKQSVSRREGVSFAVSGIVR